MQLKEVMTPSVAVIATEATIQAAAEKMGDLDIGLLPVCEGERLVGIVTDRDITVRAVAEGLIACSLSALLVLRRLAPGADEVAHRLHVGGVTGKGEAAQMPAVLDRCQHRVVVEGGIGGGR